jgi:NADPH:quinone reductase-like Zn-dependent oxidoreductase
MKAALIEEFGGIEKIQITEVQKPSVGDDQVLIKTAYASVNPVDWKIREGWLKKILPHEFPVILGWDVSGTVEEVGDAVKHLDKGDKVYAFCRFPIVHSGTYAEYVSFEGDNVAEKPENLSFEEAATIPLAALTAWQSLFDTAELKKGQSVLIHAGAGGVGSFAIQLAKNIGAKVYTTASKSNHEYVKSLGASVAIDYKTEDYVEAINEYEPEGVDVVLDCVGGDTCEKSLPLVSRGGHVVTICDLFVDEEMGSDRGVQVSSVFVTPNGKQLRDIAALYEEGKLIPPAVQTFNFEQIGMALEKSQAGHTRGKIAIKIE